MLTCLQIHNDYLIPGGETKSTKLIGDLLEASGIKVIRYYKTNRQFENTGLTSKIKLGVSSIYNFETVSEIKKILKENQVDFAIIHNVSPIISNSVYSVLIQHGIKIFKYLQNYNLLCLNGAIDKGDICVTCMKCSFVGVKNRCYKSSILYSFQKYISKKIFERKYKSKIFGYIAISEFVKEKHVQYGLPESKLHVLYHFCEDIESLLEENNMNNDYIYIGRLSSEKGIFTLIKAFEFLPNINLKIIGSGEMEENISQYIQKRSIKNVELVGFKTGNEKNEIIKGAKALIAPSEWDEPFGRIVIEAFQMGTPVIASNRGGLPELVSDNMTGFLFDSGNVSSLVESIKALERKTEYEYQEMRKSCYLEIDQKYSKNAYLKKITQILN